MKILVVGSGGREHAIALKLSESRHQPQLYFAPGNPGVEVLGQRLEIEVTDIQGLCLFARRENIDLTVVGPEIPLSLGIGDAFRQQCMAIFGPNRDGAKIESSKAYAKQLMQLAGVPTAGYRFCENYLEAESVFQAFSPPYVIKEDGLAAGKGVTIAPDLQTARQAVEAAFEKNMPVVIEEFLTGQELSVLAICDGERAIPMVAAQDFKRAYDGNQGPNTGGMGAYAPVPFVNEPLMRHIQQIVLNPMMAVLKQVGIDYRGVLYAGLMVQPEHEIGALVDAPAVQVIEFNARFGDPETQVILPLLDEDLADILMAAAQGDLGHYSHGFRFKPLSAVTVVLASEGYPDHYPTGGVIDIPDRLPDQTFLFHAGTKYMSNRQIVTAGGRVMNATGLGQKLSEARDRAYALVEAVRFERRFFRTDIACPEAFLSKASS